MALNFRPFIFWLTCNPHDAHARTSNLTPTSCHVWLCQYATSNVEDYWTHAKKSCFDGRAAIKVVWLI
eukprot:6212982-Pleurochrysis_carterae.AAC.7